MTQYKTRKIHIIASSADLMDVAENVAKTVHGKVKHVDGNRAVVRIGSRLQWKLWGFWGSKGIERIPIRVTIRRNNATTKSLTVAVAFDAGTPEFHFTTVYVVIDRKLKRVSRKIKSAYGRAS